MTEKSKQYRVGSWPRSGCYKGTSHPKLSEKQRAQIAELPYSIDNEQINIIELFYLQYLTEKTTVYKRNRRELDKELEKINMCAKQLIKLLDDQEVLAHLQNKTEELFTRELSERIVNNRFSSHPSAAILDSLKIISATCTVTDLRYNNRRPEGLDIADYRFVENLYYKCLEITGNKPTNNPNGFLQKLVQILLGPGRLSGIIRNVINKHNFKK